MALKLGSPFFLFHPSPLFSSNSYTHKNLFFLFLRKNLEPSSSSSLSFPNTSAIGAPRASVSGTPKNGVADEQGESSSTNLELDDEVISRASMLKDAGQVLELIAATSTGNGEGGVVKCPDCRRIISAALRANNSDLALSVLAAMRSSSFDQGPLHFSS